MLIDDVATRVDQEGRRELAGVARSPSRGVTRRELAYRLDDSGNPVEARPRQPGRAERGQRWVGTTVTPRWASALARNESGERGRGTAPDEDRADSESVELRQSRDEPIQPDGRSAVSPK